MKTKNIIATLALVLSAASINAQTITGFGTDVASTNGALVATINVGTIQVVGPEGGDQNFVLGSLADASLSGSRNLVLTGTFTGTNPGTSFGIELTDADFESQVYTGQWSSFTSGVPASVILTRSVAPTLFNGFVNQISFTTGGAGSINFTFDSLALVPIPEPSSYAALAGIAVLGLVSQRRRRNAFVSA